ncbi:hypothetical protein RHGRI_004025 [Rhododendron griersonianum]|uniref:Uncharacterized protein n=1 Tax=Rhododendron griersonianum TaxID=479676 RepID=A0AAV6L830_9ERIC|nr:hypothetical protein RHGRI_004025 [Rhododendron griersonianum]
MSDVALQFLLDNLQQLVVYNAKLFIDVKDEVKGLIEDLETLKAFIEDSAEKSRENKAVQVLVTKIRALTFEAEDAIDVFVMQASVPKSQKWVQKVFHGISHASKIRDVAVKVQTIRANVKEIYDNKLYGYEALHGRDPAGRRRMERRPPNVEKDNVVGFDEATTKLIGWLTGGAEDLQVFSIIGMAGLGKTTLANKIYYDPRVSDAFSSLAWIYVSQTYTCKDLFLTILKSVNQVTSNMFKMNEDMLAEEVSRILTWKYLIVVDDVWGKEDWDRIKRAFPNCKNGSRILLTSRNKPVAVVFHIQPLSSPRFPSEILKLVHLTYVAFSGDFKSIPSDVSKLWNLQTLIVETTSRTIDVKADIWKMTQFRHLHTNAASQFPGLVAKKSESIQTLSTIAPESCTEGVLGQTPYIKKLGIRGKLATLLEKKQGPLFDNLTQLQQLVTLKLLNDVFPNHPDEFKLQGLPHWSKFPPNLKRLTLAGTFLEWEHMSVLGMLPKLEELKLKDNAFTGVSWSVCDGGFKKLKALQIWKTDLVLWEAKIDHFPILKHIVLKECTELGKIPSSLGDVETLRTIKLHRTSRSAADSARAIKHSRLKRYGLRLHDQAADNSHRIEFDATAAASAEDDWIYQFPNVAPTPTAGGEISSVETQA